MHNMQKYGEIFLNRDLVRFYVCSVCNAVYESTNVVGHNNQFVTNEVCKFWNHVQQCHGDILHLLIPNFQKELSPELAKKKLEMDNVIVIDDDDDENKMLSEEQSAVSSNNTSNQNHPHQINAENTGTILISLLESAPKKLNKPESPKIAEGIQTKDEIMSIIESELRAMHGCTIEIDENKDETMQEDVKILNETLKDELQTKLDVGIYHDSENNDLDNLINEDVVDLNEAMEREDMRMGEDDDDCATTEYYYLDHNDVTKEDCEISKRVDLLNVAKENTLKEYLSKNSNNDNNKNNNEIDSEIIELTDSDEEDTEAKVKGIREKGVILHTSQRNIQVQSLQKPKNDLNNHLEQNHKQAQQRSQAHNEIIQQMPMINFQEQQKQNNQSNNQSNNHNNQDNKYDNQGNINNNQTSSNVSLATPLDMLNCDFCEQRFHALWQKNRHEKIHFPRQRRNNQCILRTFKCPACEETTSTKANMSKHIQKYHPAIPLSCIKELQPNSEYSVRIFQCQHCSRDYRSKSAMNHHVKRVHANPVTTSAAASDAMSNDAAPAPATNSVPGDSSFATPPELNSSNNLQQQQADMMNCYHRWHMESSYQPAWSIDSAYNSMESIGTLLPASCESES